MTTREASQPELRNSTRVDADLEYFTRRFAATVCTCDPFAACADCTETRRLASVRRMADDLGALQRR